MKYKEVERSIITKYRKDIYRRFVRAVSDYDLIKENDKIMVCISGGKDSFLLAKCLEELSNHGDFSFDLEYVVMNPGYKEETLNQIKKLGKELNLNIQIFNSNIFEVANKLNGESPCYMCARMRRGYLYDYAKKLNCNKIALGHHFDDVIETVLLSMFYSSEYKTMLPKLRSKNFKGIELIRPLYLVKEKSIISWANYNNLDFINCACTFTEKGESGKRQEIKKIIKGLKEINKDVDNNIFGSLSNVNLNCIIGYNLDGKKHTFLDDYE